MGLPGSGKTTLAADLSYLLNHHYKCHWLNADKVREQFNDWDFSEAGRERQGKRMRLQGRGSHLKTHVQHQQDAQRHGPPPPLPVWHLRLTAQVGMTRPQQRTPFSSDATTRVGRCHTHDPPWPWD